MATDNQPSRRQSRFGSRSSSTLVGSLGPGGAAAEPEDFSAMDNLMGGLDSEVSAPVDMLFAPLSDAPIGTAQKDSAVDVDEQTSVVPPAKAPLTKSSRAERFGGGTSMDKVLPTSANADASSDRPWAKHVAQENTAVAITVKRGMAAAKVLTPLVAAVSFNPKSDGSPPERAKALSEMLVSVHKAAVSTAEAVSEVVGEDVPSWMVTSFMGALSTSVAKQWEVTGSADPSALSGSMLQMFRSNSEAMKKMIVDASDDAYQEVTSRDVARDRISVSIVSAGWELYDWISHRSLSIEQSGGMPSQFYSYDRDIDEIVKMMLTRCVDEARALVVQVESADLRTAHLQQSIRRMANLVGAEYVTQTRGVMNWIGEENISDEEFIARRHGASAQLTTRILPHIFEWARKNFLRIELGALKAIEDMNEKPTQKNLGDASASRAC